MNKLRTYTNRSSKLKLLNGVKNVDLANSHDINVGDVHTKEDSKYPSPKKSKFEKNVDMSSVNESNNVDSLVESPIIKSRYGRTHKPKITEDFLPTDKKVGAILGLSPKRNSVPNTSVSNSPNSKNQDAVRQRGGMLLKTMQENEPNKLKEKGKRGRPRKAQGVDIMDNNSHLIHPEVIKEDIGFLKCDPIPTCDIKKETDISCEAIATSTPIMATPSADVPECDWLLGDLAWARVGGHPFWPCMVAMDPVFGVFTKTRFLGRNSSAVQRSMHVQFFGDNGRRSWVNTTGMIHYTGRQALEELSAKILSEAKNKNRKIYSAYIVRLAAKEKWETAVKESEEALLKSREERIQYFADTYPTEVIDCHSSGEESNDKSCSLDPESKKSRTSKKRKHSDVETSFEKTPKQIKLERADSSNSAISPRRNSDVKDSWKSSPPKKKRKPLQKKIKDMGIEYASFVDKHFSHVSDQHPEFNKREVEKFLSKMWSEMDNVQRSKYQPRVPMASAGMKGESSSSSEEGEDGDDESSDATSDFGPVRVSAPLPGKKGGGLFRGMRNEKACQLCLKPGETVKCKGPCLGVFHLDCIKTASLVKPDIVLPAKRGKKGDRTQSKDSSTMSISNSKKIDIDIPTDEKQNIESESEVELKKDESKLVEEICMKTRANEPDNTAADHNNLTEGIIVANKNNTKESSSVTEKQNEKAVSDNVANKDSTLSPGHIDNGSDASDTPAQEPKEDGEFRCKDCIEGRSPPCLACGKDLDPKIGSDKRHRCAVGHCGKFYHSECLKEWPQANTNGGGPSRRQVKDSSAGQLVSCPQHVCHTCASDDPRNVTMRFNHERLVRCIQCPTAYHSGNYCLPAGSEVLTGSQIICPKHYVPPRRGNHHVNSTWCFICAMGGSLICCDLCPTSFHADCLRISAPEGGYICEDCETGRFPLYGEVVWVKLGVYRWWPAQILFPNQIPDNIDNLPHIRGEFAVRFFGSHDHYWISRGRVFLYQEGDTGHRNSRKSSVDGVFQRALAEASEAHKTMKGEKATREAEARPGMKPPNYVRIKSNKPVGNVRVTEADPSSMTPCDCDPTSDNPCGPDSDCLNRILLVECTPGVCAAGDRCGNQRFEKRLYPPLVPYRTEGRGWGLKTLAKINKGDFVIEYVGEMIDETEYRNRLERKHTEKDENYYFLTIDKDRMLDAGPKGNVARFMNHSCQPNCETQKWTVNGDTRVGLFAVEDIPAETEITFNYNLECVGPDKKQCMCGAPNCSGFIGVKANKQSSLAEEDKKSRLEHQRRMKRRKKRRVTVFGKPSDDTCFKCDEGGELLLCDNKTCPKGYHLNCVQLKHWPQGKWLCPWHRCNTCRRRTIRRCGLCPNSYCPLHAEGNIVLDQDMGLICQAHNQNGAKPTAKAKNGDSKCTSTKPTSEISSEASSLSSDAKSSNETGKVSAKRIKVDKEDNVSKKKSSLQDENSVVVMEESPTRKAKSKKSSAHDLNSTVNSSVSESPLTYKGIDNTLERRKRGRPKKYQCDEISKIELKTPSKMEVGKQISDNKCALQMELADLALSFAEKDTLKTSTPKDKIVVKNKESVNGIEACRSSKRKRQPSEKMTEYFKTKPTSNLEAALSEDRTDISVDKSIKVASSPKKVVSLPTKKMVGKVHKSISVNTRLQKSGLNKKLVKVTSIPKKLKKLPTTIKKSIQKNSVHKVRGVNTNVQKTRVAIKKVTSKSLKPVVSKTNKRVKVKKIVHKPVKLAKRREENKLQTNGIDQDPVLVRRRSMRVSMAMQEDTIVQGKGDENTIHKLKSSRKSVQDASGVRRQNSRKSRDIANVGLNSTKGVGTKIIKLNKCVKATNENREQKSTYTTLSVQAQVHVDSVDSTIQEQTPEDLVDSTVQEQAHENLTESSPTKMADSTLRDEMCADVKSQKNTELAATEQTERALTLDSHSGEVSCQDFRQPQLTTTESMAENVIPHEGTPSIRCLDSTESPITKVLTNAVSQVSHSDEVTSGTISQDAARPVNTVLPEMVESQQPHFDSDVVNNQDSTAEIEELTESCSDKDVSGNRSQDSTLSTSLNEPSRKIVPQESYSSEGISVVVNQDSPITEKGKFTGQEIFEHSDLNVQSAAVTPEIGCDLISKVNKESTVITSVLETECSSGIHVDLGEMLDNINVLTQDEKISVENVPRHSNVKSDVSPANLTGLGEETLEDQGESGSNGIDISVSKQASVPSIESSSSLVLPVGS